MFLFINWITFGIYSVLFAVLYFVVYYAIFQKGLLIGVKESDVIADKVEAEEEDNTPKIRTINFKESPKVDNLNLNVASEILENHNNNRYDALDMLPSMEDSIVKDEEKEEDKVLVSVSDTTEFSEILPENMISLEEFNTDDSSVAANIDVLPDFELNDEKK